MSTIEILYFDGCPNTQPTIELVRAVAADYPDAEVVELAVAQDDVVARRFLGSPSVRVDGIDIDPGAGDRTDYQYACRIFQTRAGPVGVPPEDWVRVALQEAQGPTPILGRGRTCHCSPECWCRSGWRRRLRWIWPARHR